MTGTIPFEITGKTGEIEFRKYPSVVLATTASDGDETGFNLLTQDRDDSARRFRCEVNVICDAAGNKPG